VVSIYRGMDRATLDLEYSPSAKLPGGIMPYLDAYARLSAQALAEPGVRPALRYGDHPDEVLDLFLPAGPGPWPLHIFIHGGFWQELSQREFAFPGPVFQQAGVAYAAINHTLAPAARIGEMIDQCRRAVAWLWAQADRLGLDPSRITLSGHSAGAHLCAMLMTTDWPAFGAPRDIVKHALLISGVYDLEPIRLTYVDKPLGLSGDEVAAWSPQRLDLPAACPTAVIWGEDDTPEFKRQSAEFAEKLYRAGTTVAGRELPRLNHFDILFGFLDDCSALMEMALKLLQRTP
jgi:arylformamidase